VAKNYPKRCQIAKISNPLQEIDVAENDGDNRFRSESTNNVDSAHVQRKVVLNGRKRFLIAEVSVSHRKSGSLNPMALSKFLYSRRVRVIIWRTIDYSLMAEVVVEV